MRERQKIKEDQEEKIHTTYACNTFYMLVMYYYTDILSYLTFTELNFYTVSIT